VWGNFIGLSVECKRIKNEKYNYHGIYLTDDASENYIGGFTKHIGTPPGNIITGNYRGIGITGSNENQIKGNIFGLDNKGAFF